MAMINSPITVIILVLMPLFHSFAVDKKTAPTIRGGGHFVSIEGRGSS